MKTIQANIPEYLARLAAEAAAKRGNLETLDRILARVPNVPPLPGDEL